MYKCLFKYFFPFDEDLYFFSSFPPKVIRIVFFRSKIICKMSDCVLFFIKRPLIFIFKVLCPLFLWINQLLLLINILFDNLDQ